MGLGALILCAAMWNEVAATSMAALGRADRAEPGCGAPRSCARSSACVRVPTAAPRWGRYWATGSTLAGALWGVAAVAMFPASPAYQALLIVCLFGAALGGLNLTAVYKPSFYGFVLPALVPLIVRVALVGDPVHFFIAGVMSVVLAFVVGFGHRLNDVLTRSLVIRYENVDLIGELKERTRIALEARAAAEAANRAKSQLLAAASHDLRQPLHALGLYVAALAARAREAGVAAARRPRRIRGQRARAAVRAIDRPVAPRRRRAGARALGRSARRRCSRAFARSSRAQAAARGLAFDVVATRLVVRQRRVAARAHRRQPGRQRAFATRTAAAC